MHTVKCTLVKWEVRLYVPETSQRSYLAVTHSHIHCLSFQKRGCDTSNTSLWARTLSAHLSLWQVDVAQSGCRSISLKPRSLFSTTWPQRWMMVSYLCFLLATVLPCLESGIKLFLAIHQVYIRLISPPQSQAIKHIKCNQWTTEIKHWKWTNKNIFKTNKKKKINSWSSLSLALLPSWWCKMIPVKSRVCD